jgi:hypothetical protein
LRIPAEDPRRFGSDSSHLVAGQLGPPTVAEVPANNLSVVVGGCDPEGVRFYALSKFDPLAVLPHKALTTRGTKTQSERQSRSARSGLNR